MTSAATVRSAILATVRPGYRVDYGQLVNSYAADGLLRRTGGLVIRAELQAMVAEGILVGGSAFTREEYALA